MDLVAVKATAPVTNDVLRVTGTLTLAATNLAGPPAAGDSFKLFNAGNYPVNFINFMLPALGTGLG